MYPMLMPAPRNRNRTFANRRAPIQRQDHVTKTPRPQRKPPEKRKRLAALWSLAKVGGPAVVSVAALIISLLTYQNQRAANAEQNAIDAAAAASSREAYAAQVSYWLVAGAANAPPDLVVQNRGSAPILDVTATITASRRNVALYNGAVLLGTIPPCSIVTTSVIAMVVKVLASTYDVRSLYFTDASGLSWERLNRGVLKGPEPASAIPTGLSEPYDLYGKVSAADGCS